MTLLEIAPEFDTPQWRKHVKALNGENEAAYDRAFEALSKWMPEWPFSDVSKAPDFCADEELSFGNESHVKLIATGPFRARQEELYDEDQEILERAALVITEEGELGLVDPATLVSLQPQYEAAVKLATQGRCVIWTEDLTGWFDKSLEGKLIAAGFTVENGDCGFREDEAEEFANGDTRVLMLSLGLHEEGRYEALNEKFETIYFENGRTRRGA